MMFWRAPALRRKPIPADLICVKANFVQEDTSLAPSLNWRTDMTEAATKLPVKTETKTAAGATSHAMPSPFANLHREINRLFDAFDGDFWRSPVRRSLLEPVWQREMPWAGAPAVDVAETDKSYEITAELPGMDEKNIEVNVANGGITIKGEKKEETEEKIG